MKFSTAFLAIFLLTLFRNGSAVRRNQGGEAIINLEPVVNELLSTYPKWIESSDFDIPRLSNFDFSYTEQIYLKRYASLKYKDQQKKENILRALKDAAVRVNLEANLRQTPAGFNFDEKVEIIYNEPFEVIKTIFLIKDLKITKFVALIVWMVNISGPNVLTDGTFQSILNNSLDATDQIDSFKMEILNKILAVLKSNNLIKEKSIPEIINISESGLEALLNIRNVDTLTDENILNSIEEIISNELDFDEQYNSLLIDSQSDEITLNSNQYDDDLVSSVIKLVQNYQANSKNLLRTLLLIEKEEIRKVYEIYKWTDNLTVAIVKACLVNDDIVEGLLEIFQNAETERLTNKLKESEEVLNSEQAKRYLTPECAEELRLARTEEGFCRANVRKILKRHGILKTTF